jgi:ketosteroid isomerase-like protein
VRDEQHRSGSVDVDRARDLWNSEQSRRMAAAVEALIHEYARRYSARHIDAVTELCLWPFVAIREGAAIPLADRDAVRDHFRTMIDAYRDAGYASFAPVAIDTPDLGERAAFATVRWHALDTDGQVARDTQTTYHLLATPDGWRILSYTNHSDPSAGNSA